MGLLHQSEEILLDHFGSHEFGTEPVVLVVFTHIQPVLLRKQYQMTSPKTYYRITLGRLVTRVGNGVREGEWNFCS